MMDLNDKVTGGTLTAAEWNEVPSELQNIIEGLGITLSGADLNQVGKAIAGYVANGDFYTDSGAADAYVLSVIGSKQAPTAYTDGFQIRFVPGNANTGASTVNVASLGVKSITTADGSALAAGDISAAEEAIAVFDSGNDRFELATPALITDFTGSNQTLAATGFQKLPGGLILQWGVNSVALSGTAVVFSIAFPNAAFLVVSTDDTLGPIAAGTVKGMSGAGQFTTTGFNMYGDAGGQWIALGN